MYNLASTCCWRCQGSQQVHHHTLHAAFCLLVSSEYAMTNPETLMIFMRRWCLSGGFGQVQNGCALLVATDLPSSWKYFLHGGDWDPG